ncbi:MAG: glutathione transferase GstA [Pseudomonadota bacterium]|nr:glutathione transferase GstA [Pseudomonadota bacterium]
MKLYYAPGACSLAPHIALAESGVPCTLSRVDLAKHTAEDGADFYKINPKGYVPFLHLDDGNTLSEAAVLLQYIADQRPGTLAPAAGTLERYKLMEWLNFIATEVHKGFGPLWNPNAPDATKDAARKQLAKRFGIVEERLRQAEFLQGNTFSVADAYLFTVTRWAGMQDVSIAEFPGLGAFMKRVAERPNVRKALKEEGLLKE